MRCNRNSHNELSRAPGLQCMHIDDPAKACAPKLGARARSSDLVSHFDTIVCSQTDDFLTKVYVIELRV